MDIIFAGMHDSLYGDKIRKNFFKSKSDRNLWIRLNAERIQYSQKILNDIDMPLGEIGDRFSCTQVSINQLEYDEYERQAPRFSLEELFLLSQPELFRLADERNREKIQKMFVNSKDI
jgi:hypothetical protein